MEVRITILNRGMRHVLDTKPITLFIDDQDYETLITPKPNNSKLVWVLETPEQIQPQKPRLLAGKKDPLVKPQVALIPYEPEILEAEAWAYGAYVKYTPWNWVGGRPYTELASSLRHHVAAWMEHEIFDPESGVHHLGHARCNLSMLISFEAMNRIDLDDRRPIDTITAHKPTQHIKE